MIYFFVFNLIFWSIFFYFLLVKIFLAQTFLLIFVEIFFFAKSFYLFSSQTISRRSSSAALRRVRPKPVADLPFLAENQKLAPTFRCCDFPTLLSPLPPSLSPIPPSLPFSDSPSLSFPLLFVCKLFQNLYF
jgi:hypothetical protein